MSETGRNEKEVITVAIWDLFKDYLVVLHNVPVDTITEFEKALFDKGVLK